MAQEDADLSALQRCNDGKDPRASGETHTEPDAAFADDELRDLGQAVAELAALQGAASDAKFKMVMRQRRDETKKRKREEKAQEVKRHRQLEIVEEQRKQKERKTRREVPVPIAAPRVMNDTAQIEALRSLGLSAVEIRAIMDGNGKKQGRTRKGRHAA